MAAVYTSIGECMIKKGEKGYYPVIFSRNREYEVSIHEMRIWAKTANRIMTLHELVEAISQQGIYIEKNMVYDTIRRLETRNLLVSAEGLTLEAACYDLLKNLWIRPTKDSFLKRIAEFFNQTFRIHVPLRNTIQILKRPRYSASQKLVLQITKEKEMCMDDVVKYVNQQAQEKFADISSFYIIKMEIFKAVLCLHKIGAIQLELLEKTNVTNEIENK